jgi:hypothetical protein
MVGGWWVLNGHRYLFDYDRGAAKQRNLLRLE